MFKIQCKEFFFFLHSLLTSPNGGYEDLLPPEQDTENTWTVLVEHYTVNTTTTHWFILPKGWKEKKKWFWLGRENES